MLGDGYAMLSEAECHRVERFLVERPKREFIASHAALRYILSDYLGQPPEVLAFGVHQHGKPYLLSQDSSLEFNLSHTRGRAMVGVTKQQPIGVDIEWHKPHLAVEELAQRFFAKSEYEQVMLLPAVERYLAFYRIWTRKEAFIKVTGRGLSFGLGNFEVSLQEDCDDCLLSVNDSAKLARQWTLAPVFIRERSYTAAFAVSGLVNNVQLKNWSPNIAANEG